MLARAANLNWDVKDIILQQVPFRKLFHAYFSSQGVFFLAHFRQLLQDIATTKKKKETIVSIEPDRVYARSVSTSYARNQSIIIAVTQWAYAQTKRQTKIVSLRDSNYKLFMHGYR